MRRADRKIQSFEEMVDVISRCDVCRLGLHDGDYPYILPLNFGVKAEKETQVVTLYFHSALQGRKIELMKKNNLASFEMDCRHQLQYKAEQGMCTFAYESIIGHGTIHMIEDADEKMQALKILMNHYYPGENKYFNPAAIPRTAVYCLEVIQMSGKKKGAEVISCWKPLDKNI